MNATAPRRIVLTGVSRGLGRAMAEGLIARGHVVLGCARSPQPVDELRRQYGPPHAFEVVDVSRDDEVRAWAERVLADGGAPGQLAAPDRTQGRCETTFTTST